MRWNREVEGPFVKAILLQFLIFMAFLMVSWIVGPHVLIFQPHLTFELFRYLEWSRGAKIIQNPIGDASNYATYGGSFGLIIFCFC